MGSLIPFDDIADDRDFFQLLMSLGVVLNRTVKEILIEPTDSLIYEFEEPSVTSILTCNYIFGTLSQEYKRCCDFAGVKPDDRVSKVLNPADSTDFAQLLDDI